MTELRGLRLTGTWVPAERQALVAILKPLPPAWVERNPLVLTIRREPVLRNAPPDAPGHSKYDPVSRSIVVFDKGVYHGEEIDPRQFRRSVYHELAHTLLHRDPSLLQRWRSATSGDGFVDNYAKTGPEEDFADSFSELFIDPAATKRAVPAKARFLAELLANTQEKIAMSFTTGFTDEMMKTAKFSLSGLKKLVSKGGAKAVEAERTPGKMGVGKALGLAGLTGGGAYFSGKASGVSAGREEGAAGMSEGMRQAYKMGVQRGARAMQQAIMQRLRIARGEQ